MKLHPTTTLVSSMRIRKTRKKAIASKCLVDPSEHIVVAVTLRLVALLEPAAVFVQT